MGLNDKELSHLRMMANGIVAESNRKNPWAAAVEARRTELGARLTLTLRPGGEKPSEPMLELGDLADAVRNELRLERDRLGAAIWGTSESTFETEGHPYFTFEVWRLEDIA